MWQVLSLGDLGVVVTGRTPPSAQPELFGDTFPFITPSDMTSGCRRAVPERFLSKEGGAAFGRIALPPDTPAFVCIGATIGKVCLTETKSFTNQQLNSIVVDRERHDPRYVYYLLAREAPRIQSLAGGAATPIISKSSFSAVEVRVPALDVQRRIASILSAYDDLIENNTRRIAILEEIARRLYEEWFVKFRFPGHGDTGFNCADLESVPDGWRRARWGELADLKYGKALRGYQDAKGSFPVFGTNGLIGYHTEFLSKSEGVIIGRKGAYRGVHFSDRPFFVIDTAFFLHPKGDVPFDLRWAYYQLKSFDINNIDSGTAIPSTSREAFSQILVTVPPLIIQQRFREVAAPIWREATVLEAKNSNLRAQRDLLLPKLISGEIDVSEISDDALKAAE